jgi:hypothetical protein
MDLASVRPRAPCPVAQRTEQRFPNPLFAGSLAWCITARLRPEGEQRRRLRRSRQPIV